MVAYRLTSAWARHWLRSVDRRLIHAASIWGGRATKVMRGSRWLRSDNYLVRVGIRICDTEICFIEV
jgi:hypothetical protein